MPKDVLYSNIYNSKSTGTNTQVNGKYLHICNTMAKSNMAHPFYILLCHHLKNKVGQYILTENHIPGFYFVKKLRIIIIHMHILYMCMCTPIFIEACTSTRRIHIEVK